MFQFLRVVCNILFSLLAIVSECVCFSKDSLCTHSVHVISKGKKHADVLFEGCCAVDNAALFQMKGHSVRVIIMTQGGAVSLHQGILFKCWSN